MPARAKLPPGEGKRVPLNMRTTPKTRGQLERAAAESGRSLVQEVETRLERSFLSDDAKFDDFGGKEKYALARLFAVSADLLEPRLREVMKKLRAAGRLPKSDAEEPSEKTWANNWTFFQFAVAFWTQVAKQAHFEVPAGIEAFEAALLVRGQPGSKGDDLNELGALIRDWMTNEPEDQPLKK